MPQNKQFSREAILEHIKKNKDYSIKETGDIVLMWDTSRLTDIDTLEVNTDLLDHAILCTYPSIVIDDRLRINADIVLDERVYPCNLDIMIWNKTLDKKFYTSSLYVKITTEKV
jgi:hypothetical protein